MTKLVVPLTTSGDYTKAITLVTLAPVCEHLAVRCWAETQ